MVKTSVLNDALNAINNAEKAGKRQVMIRPSSKVIVKFLTVMQRHGTLPSCLLRIHLVLHPSPG
jgi:small subunit ribosomal protein S15Ae